MMMSRCSSPGAPLPPPADAVIAVIQLISANYMGQHFFMEEMSGMSSAYNFQHSTAWAQVGPGRHRGCPPSVHAQDGCQLQAAVPIAPPRTNAPESFIAL